MGPTMRNAVPFTLALAFLVFLVSNFLLSVDTLQTAHALTFGVLIGGLLVPLLMQVKPLDAAASSPTTIHSEQAPGSTVTLYVGNLPYKANEDAVKVLFQKFGQVHNVRLMKDRQTGRRRGFGFVEVAASDSEKMTKSLNEFEYEGRTLKVREAKERSEHDENDE